MGSMDPSSWRKTTIVLIIISISEFLIQRTALAVFDPVFELFIFHFPALFSAVIYLKVRSQKQ